MEYIYDSEHCLITVWEDFIEATFYDKDLRFKVNVCFDENGKVFQSLTKTKTLSYHEWKEKLI